MAGLVGPDAYQQFMSPYQQQVIDTTLSEFDRQQTIADTALRDQAIQAGAYGGGREGVMAAESARGAATNRAQLTSTIISTRISTSTSCSSTRLSSKTRTW